MTSIQKIIKYFSFAFAILLCVAIFSGIASVGIALIKGFDIVSDSIESENDVRNYTDESSYLDIDIKYSDLQIVTSDKLLSETDSKYITSYQDGNTLRITERTSSIFKKHGEKLTIYIPESIVFDSVFIKNKAGKITIDEINTQKLELRLGAGETRIKNVISSSSIIKTGAGDVKVLNGNLKDLELSSGVGDIDITSDITGETTLNCGVGNVKLNLQNTIDNYTIDIKKGVGNVYINGINTGNSIKGNGENQIKIRGGVGNIEVNTPEILNN